MTLYVSDHSLFMREQMAKHPEWAEDQLTGRALLWDKKQNLAQNKAFAESSVAKRAYPYDTNFEKIV